MLMFKRKQKNKKDEAAEAGAGAGAGAAAGARGDMAKSSGYYQVLLQGRCMVPEATDLRKGYSLIRAQNLPMANMQKLLMRLNVYGLQAKSWHALSEVVLDVNMFLVKTVAVAGRCVVVLTQVPGEAGKKPKYEVFSLVCENPDVAARIGKIVSQICSTIMASLMALRDKEAAAADSAISPKDISKAAPAGDDDYVELGGVRLETNDTYFDIVPDMDAADELDVDDIHLEDGDEFHEMVAGERAPNPAFLRRFSKQIRRTATNDFVLRGQREDDSTWERVRRESLPS